MSNELQIVSLRYEDQKVDATYSQGHLMIPIKTVCELIDVNYKTQDSWLKKHKILSNYLGSAPLVASDNKPRDMNCLPLLQAGLWVAGISNKNRKEGSIEKQNEFVRWVIHQHDTLYKSIQKFIEDNKYEHAVIDEITSLVDAIQEDERELKSKKNRLKKARASLDEIRLNMYKGQQELPFDENKK